MKTSPPLATALILLSGAGTAHAAMPAGAVSGIVYFVVLFGLLIYAATARVLDARAGLSTEEKQRRLKRRLPWVMGGFFAASAYIALSI